MATTDVTAEQQAAWDSFQAKSFGAVQGMTHVVGTTFTQAFQAVAKPVNYLNDITPSLVPGRPMTSIINDKIVQPAAEIIADAPETYADMKQAAMFVGGVAQNIPLTPAAVVQDMASGNSFEQIGGFFQSAFNTVAVNTLQNAATPADMTNMLAGRPEFAGEQGQKLINILKTDEAFATSLHGALTKDPTVAEGFLGLNGGGEEGQPLDYEKLAAQMSDPGTREKFGKILDAVAQSPDDNLNFKYMMDVAELTEIAATGKASPEQLEQLQSKLKMAGVSDMWLDMSVDPMGFFMDAMQDPVGFFQQLASNITFEGPIGDMMRGFVEAIGQYFGVVTSGGSGFFDHYIQPLVDDIPNFMNQLDDGQTVTTAAAPVQVITGTGGPRINPTSPDQVNSQIDLSNLVGSRNDIGADANKMKLVNAFEPASVGVVEPLPPPFKPEPIQMDHARAFAFTH